MDKVNDKLEDLVNEYGSLYYDKKEYHNELVYELGTKDGIEIGAKNNSIEIAKKMLGKNMDINLISEVTSLTIEEIKDL